MRRSAALASTVRNLLMLTAASLAATFLGGCGGADLASSGRSSGFDSGLTGNYSGYGSTNGTLGTTAPSDALTRGTYARIETSFELPDLKGNPFDYTVNDIQVTFMRPGGQKAAVPAFYDGGNTWRARYTPDAPGRYAVASVSRNGQAVEPAKFGQREFTVTGNADAGFVRIDGKDHARFAFASGASYYPIGHNVGWGDVPAVLGKMGQGGENWARVWMCHWDGKNLDWSEKGNAIGTLDLEAARKWDGIVEAAEKSHIYLQMVLQHHGQYSTRVNENWNENPWNTRNGGFLSTPDEFFSNPRALALTRAKYRYIVARWGYSPNILAWELFNEVEWTDAVFHKHVDEVAAWHNGMVEFLRKQDPNHHLITSSSDQSLTTVFEHMDFLQPHAYVGDPKAAVAQFDNRKQDRPIFFGEMGPSEGLDSDDGRWLHGMLWSSAMSTTAGAAQYWSWEAAEKNNLYSHWRSLTSFLDASGLASRRGAAAIAVECQTTGRGPLTLSPGAGWAKAERTEYTVYPSGASTGMGTMPAYLQGDSHRDMMPQARFSVDYPEDGTFTVAISKVSAGGAHLVLEVDGKPAGEKSLRGTGADAEVKAELAARVPRGAHVVTLRNTGADWAVVKQITLNPYAPTVAVSARGGRDYAAAWVSPRGGDAGARNAKLIFPGMQPGAYSVHWWNCAQGKPADEGAATASADGKLTISTPEMGSDLAVYIRRSEPSTAGKNRPAKRENAPSGRA